MINEGEAFLLNGSTRRESLKGLLERARLDSIGRKVRFFLVR